MVQKQTAAVPTLESILDTAKKATAAAAEAAAAAVKAVDDMLGVFKTQLAEARATRDAAIAAANEAYVSTREGIVAEYEKAHPDLPVELIEPTPVKTSKGTGATGTRGPKLDPFENIKFSAPLRTASDYPEKMVNLTVSYDGTTYTAEREDTSKVKEAASLSAAVDQPGWCHASDARYAILTAQGKDIGDLVPKSGPEHITVLSGVTVPTTTEAEVEA